RIDAILESLLAEIADERDEKLKLLSRCGLSGFLWDQLKRYYGYKSESPGLQDFVISLFKECYNMGLGENYVMTPDTLVFLSRWKDSRKHYNSFEKLSNQSADILNIAQDLIQREIKQITTLDYFRLIDQRILSELVRNVVDKTISEPEFESLIRSRKESYWYKDFKNEYEAVKHGFRLLGLLDKTDLNVDSIDDGLRRYSKNWFKLDQHYRKFIYHYQSSRQISLLEKLNEQVENQYVNNFLLKINNNWQKVVDQCDKWSTTDFNLQRKFYSKYIMPFMNNNKKVFVIISDALRYETGEEFLRLIRKEDRYEAQLDPLLSMIPSSTQLGMASLLP
ncbi:BREX-1 system phosphatase PglZ type A, partial [bacterium]|nr:BREX-1 system phosphatase PglZ type A [bacterium]